MDCRSLSPSQLHSLDLASTGAFLTVLRESMIAGPYLDADVQVDFQGRGYVIEIVFGARRDGCLGKMACLVIEDANALPEPVRLGLMLLQVETFQAAMAECRRRSEARVARIVAERSGSLPR